jgi:DNA mismatch endonuclease (patch repair protein)
VDNVSKEKRSQIMRAIKSKGTGPELVMSALLGRVVDFRQVELQADLPGKPDFAIRDIRTAIFVHGCFFHGCPTHYKRPKSNVDFWVSKVQANMRRDTRSVRALWRRGWHVIRVWEHDLRPNCAERTKNRLLNRLRRNGDLAYFTGLRASHGNDPCALGHE